MVADAGARADSGRASAFGDRDSRWLRHSRLWVCSVMPFGLCFAWKDFGLEGSYFVYPRPRGVSLEERNLGSDGDLQGAAQVVMT